AACSPKDRISPRQIRSAAEGRRTKKRPEKHGYGRNNDSSRYPQESGRRRASLSGLPVLRLRVADAGILRRTGERVALLDRNLVLGVALVFVRFLVGVGLLRCRVMARIGRDTIDLGVRLRFDEPGLRLLHADVLAVAGQIVAFFDCDIVL